MHINFSYLILREPLDAAAAAAAAFWHWALSFNAHGPPQFIHSTPGPKEVHKIRTQQKKKRNG